MNNLEGLRIGCALTGSFCSFEHVFEVLEGLKESGAELIPLMSETAYCTDTRFGAAERQTAELERLTGRGIIHTIAEAEPIGPQKMFDVLLIAPCTGNTLAKLAHGINDGAVTMAAKSHLRNDGAVVLALSTNDALSAGAENIGRLLNRRNIYFVPFYQDDPQNKPRSLTSHWELIPQTVISAVRGVQLKPIVG